MSRLKILRRDTISQKLTFITMSIAVTVLLMTTTVFLYIDIRDFRQHMIEELSAQADIVGYNSAVGIIFDDSSEVAQILSSFKSRKNIVKAIVYLPHGTYFASYGEGPPVFKIPPNSPKKMTEIIDTKYAQFLKGRLVVIQPIIFEGDELGFIHIEANLEDLYNHVALDLTSVIVFLLAAIPISFLLSRKLQKQFSDPILNIAEVAKQVSREKDYSIRAVKLSNDELGILSDVFNEMLENIQERDAKLKQYAEGLEAEIVERKQVEQKLEILNRAIEQAGESVIITNSEGIIEYVNPGFEEITEYREEEVIGQTPRILKSEKQDEKYYKELWNTITSGRNWKGTLINKKKSGELYAAEMTISPVKNVAGDVSHFVAITHDVTERKKMEEALRDSEEKIRSILDNSSSAIFLKDAEGRHLLVNNNFATQFNATKEEIIGKTNYDLFPREVADSILQKDQKVLKTKKPLEYEEDVVLHGEKRTYFSTKFPLLDSNGVVYALCGISTDITERKRAQETVRRQRDYLDKLHDSIAEPIFSVKIPERIIARVNSAVETVFGYKTEECIGQDVAMLYHDEKSYLVFGSKIKEAIKNGMDVVHSEGLLKRKNGEIFPSEVTTSFIKENGEVTEVISIIKDITERKKAEETLKDFTRKLVESQENERKRIAGELHDNLAQDLLVINNELKTYIKSVSIDSNKLRPLKDASKLAIHMIDKIREISYDLRPSQLDKLGFKKGVESLVGRLSDSSGVAISADIKLRNFKIPFEIEINIFRIIQEGLNNIIKHSSAQFAFVKVHYKDKNIILQISDDGKGFDPDSSSHKMRLKHAFGLQGITERVKLVGGEFILESTPNKGTNLNISIPD